MQKLDGGISGLWISGECFIKESWYNFRTSDDIDMKPGPKKQSLTSETQLSTLNTNTTLAPLLWVNVLFLNGFLPKNPDISKIVLKPLVVKDIVFEITYVCVLMYQISSSKHKSNES